MLESPRLFSWVWLHWRIHLDPLDSCGSCLASAPQGAGLESRSKSHPQQICLQIIGVCKNGLGMRIGCMVPDTPVTAVELNRSSSCWPWPCTAKFFTGTCYSILLPLHVPCTWMPMARSHAVYVVPLDIKTGRYHSWAHWALRIGLHNRISGSSPSGSLCESLLISAPGCSILFQNPLWESRTGWSRIKKLLYKIGARASLRRDLWPSLMIRLSTNMHWPFLSC